MTGVRGMKVSRRLFGMTIIVLILFALSVFSVALESFNITAYDINMVVCDDNSYLITETIDIAYSRALHGIIRTLPMKTYRNRPAAISGIKVLNHKFSTSRAGSDLEIKIGDPDRFASASEQYVISYVYTIGEDGLRDMDELYWNLIGTDWACPIENITFTIKMPRAFNDEKLNFTYGSKGSTKNDAVTWRVDDGTISGSLQTALAPNEALTVALPLPQGYYAHAQPLRSSAMARFGWLFPLAAAIVGVGLWAALGRKRQCFPTVEFYPPQGVTSADAGFLIDGRVDPFDVTSLIIFWANKGYLTITEQVEKKIIGTRKSFLLTRLRDPGNDARTYERDMFTALFYLGDGTHVNTEQLKNRFYLSAGQAREQIKNSFEKDKQTRIFASSNTLCRWLLRLVGMLGLLPCTYVVMKVVSGSKGITLLGISVLMSSFTTIALFVLAYMLANWKGLPKGQRFQHLLMTSGFCTVFCGTLGYTALSEGMLLTCVISFVLLFLIGTFSCFCNRRTELGVWYEAHLTGFKEFLKATELDRIRLLVEENPQYFYHVLPFAMVLGVTDKWAKNFNRIMTAPPNWYHSASMYGGFSAVQFAHDLESGMRGVSATMNSRPSSSGSGGSSDGGSAGGGSGGGGGKGW